MLEDIIGHRCLSTGSKRPCTYSSTMTMGSSLTTKPARSPISRRVHLAMKQTNSLMHTFAHSAPSVRHLVAPAACTRFEGCK